MFVCVDPLEINHFPNSVSEGSPFSEVCEKLQRWKHNRFSVCVCGCRRKRVEGSLCRCDCVSVRIVEKIDLRVSEMGMHAVFSVLSLFLSGSL